MSVYLDHAATTAMLPVAIAAVNAASATVGNASSLHASGRAARRTVEESRETLAAAVGARPSEVIFTGGGTESDNLALKGIFWARRAAEPERNRIIVSPAEHHAVLDSVMWLAAHEHAELTWLEVERDGAVTAESMQRAIGDDPRTVALASSMWANNEIGTLTDVAALAEVLAPHGIPLHTDAVQAVGTVPVDFAASGAAALSLTGHKLGGPYGAGALLLRRDVACTPLLHGGGQERDVRSGTLNVAGIAGLAAATAAAVASIDVEAPRVRRLRDRLQAGILARVAGVCVNGALANRLPGTLHVSFPGCEGDSLLMLLDASGIECSTGSACAAGVAQPSHVLLAIGVEPDLARASLRFSLGHTTTDADVDAVLDVIAGVVGRARDAGLARRPGSRFQRAQGAAGVQVPV